MGIFNNTKQTVSNIPSKANQTEVNNGDADKYMTGYTFLHSDTINKLIYPNIPSYYAACAHNKNDRVQFYPDDNINVKKTTGFARYIVGTTHYIMFQEAGIYHISYIDTFQNIGVDDLEFKFYNKH